MLAISPVIASKKYADLTSANLLSNQILKILDCGTYMVSKLIMRLLIHLLSCGRSVIIFSSWWK